MTGFLVAASNTTCGCAAGFVPDHHEDDGTNVTTFDQKCTCDKEFYLQGSSCVPCSDGKIKSGLGTGAELCVEPAGLSTAATASIAGVIIVVALLTLLAFLAFRRKSNAKVRMADSKTKYALEEKEEASKQVREKEKENVALQNQLYAAQKLVKQVMSEGGKLLDTYHLDYSDIDFGGEDEDDRSKLGEGAHVICPPPPKHGNLKQQKTDQHYSLGDAGSAPCSRPRSVESAWWQSRQCASRRSRSTS